MAGRYVLLEFDDRDAANAFVQNDTMARQLGYRRLGLFMSPDKFCDCPDKKRQHANNWRRGRRTGLQLCVRCKKPSIFHKRGLMERLIFSLGYNLMEIEDEEE